MALHGFEWSVCMPIASRGARGAPNQLMATFARNGSTAHVVCCFLLACAPRRSLSPTRDGDEDWTAPM
eukprot:672369-Alexandrium_andersonii.AAC.1